MSDTANISVNGYTCNNCGTWVPNGSLHACWQPNTLGNTSGVSFAPNPTVVALNEIRDALWAIHKSLEITRKRDTLHDE